MFWCDPSYTSQNHCLIIVWAICQAVPLPSPETGGSPSWYSHDNVGPTWATSSAAHPPGPTKWNLYIKLIVKPQLLKPQLPKWTVPASSNSSISQQATSCSIPNRSQLSLVSNFFQMSSCGRQKHPAMVEKHPQKNTVPKNFQLPGFIRIAPWRQVAGRIPSFASHPQTSQTLDATRPSQSRFKHFAVPNSRSLGKVRCWFVLYHSDFSILSISQIGYHCCGRNKYCTWSKFIKPSGSV